jgi:hypothetical protein
MDNFNLKKFLRDQYLAESKSTPLTERMDSGTDVDTMTDVGTYVVDTLNDFLDPGRMITFEVEYNDDMSISVMHGIDAQRIREDINEAGNSINLSLTQGELNTLKEALDCLADFHNMTHEDNEEMAMNYRSILAKLDGLGINENDDVQAKVNDASKVKSKGGAEKKQARKGYGDKPNKSGRGKEMKRKMNKRNRKDAKQALKDA